LTGKNPGDKDGYLFLGLGYQRMHDYEKANACFEKAKSLMADDERAVFENVGYLKAGGIDETVIRAGVSDTAGFWAHRDPLFLSPYNERKLEHYSRVAEANLRFSIPRKNIEGWQTDRGRMLIKYGVPECRVQTRSRSDSAMYTNDFWYYDDISFVFEKWWGVTEKPFKIGVWGGFNFNEIVRAEEKTLPELYTYEPRGALIEFPYDIAGFRGKDGATRLEVYYGVPFNAVGFIKEYDTYTGKYRSGVFLFDEHYDAVVRDIQDKELRFYAGQIDTASNDLAIDQYSYEVNPGRYYMGIEIEDRQSDNTGTFRDWITVEEYGYDSLQMSDIQLALDILPLGSGPYARNDLVISPSPHRFYHLRESIFIYYEIYNLMLDGDPGRSSFQVDYTLQYLAENKPFITDFVRRLVVNEVDRGIALSFQYRGSARDEYQFLRIDHNLRKPGRYKLTLKVTDLVTGASVQKSVALRMFANREP